MRVVAERGAAATRRSSPLVPCRCHGLIAQSHSSLARSLFVVSFVCTSWPPRTTLGHREKCLKPGTCEKHFGSAMARDKLHS
eukprot:scaffold9727_cov115-Isochrysis_galbana.AAC.2